VNGALYPSGVTSPTHAAAQAANSFTGRRPRRARRLLLAILVLALVLGTAHAALLWWMSGQIQGALEHWASLRRAQGWQVEYATPERGGWPFDAALRLPSVRLATGGLEWRAEALRLSVTPEHHDRLRLDVQGAQQLSLGGPPMPLQTNTLRAELALNGNAPPLAGTLTGTVLRLDSPPGPVVLEGLQAAFDAAGPASATALTARLHGLVLPGNQPLGSRLEEITLQAMLHGDVPASGPVAQRATAWRDAGGRLEVQGMTLRWGAMAASAAATLAVDEALQPSGAGTLRIANPAQALDALAAGGLVPPRTAATARQILPLLTRLDPANGGVPLIELPVTLEKGALSAARIPLLRLPPVRWP
jgi:hypothetical protein